MAASKKDEDPKADYRRRVAENNEKLAKLHPEKAHLLRPRKRPAKAAKAAPKTESD